MRRLAIALILSASMLGGCGPSPRVAAQGPTARGFDLGALPTSPAGFSDDIPPTLAQRIIRGARAFRGNPEPLGVLTGAVLLAALVFGVYTIGVAYRQPPGRR